MSDWPGRDDLWTTGRLSTSWLRRRVTLCEAGDGNGTATTRLTCGDFGFSTIHSTYYCY